MQAVNVTPLNPNLMTDEQFKELKKWLKKNCPLGASPAGTLHWMEENGIKDIKANIAALTGLADRCDDHHVIRVKTSDWEAEKYEDPNHFMKDYEWDEYIDDIIYNTTEGENVGDWDANKVRERANTDDQQITEAISKLKAVNMRINIQTIQRELKLMGRELPINGGYIEGFLEQEAL